MISAPFELLQLPKLQATAEPADPSRDFPVVPGAESVFVAVPGCSIYQLGVQPPQVVGAHSVAPGTRVSALLVEVDTLLAYATVERSRSFLKRLSAEGAVEAVVEVPYEVRGLYSFDNHLVALDTHGQFACYNSDLGNAFTSLENGELLYAQLLHAGDALSVLTVLHRNGQTRVVTWGVDLQAARELTSADLPVRGDAYSGSQARLFAAEGGALRMYSLPSAELVAACDLDGEVRGLCALSDTCAAISRDSVLELLDCSFGARVAGEALARSDAYLVGVCSPVSTGVILCGDRLLGATISPTNGSLLESLGRGLQRTSATSLPLSDIFGQFTGDVLATAAMHCADAEAERDAVLSGVRAAIAERDGPAFARVITYFKQPDARFEELEVPTSLEEQVYEESDRNADRGLIYEVCKLAFLPRFKPFLPLNVAVYLLTHPLFPTNEPEFRNFLCALEKSDALLYRQAVASLAGVSAEDLVRALTSLDEQTFLFAAARLQEDFGRQMVLQAIRSTFRGLPSLSSLSVLAQRLARYPQTLGLLLPFIDAMGLLSWDADELQALKQRIIPLVAAAESSARVDVALAALLASSGYNYELGEIDKHKKSRETRAKAVPKYSIETLVLR